MNSRAKPRVAFFDFACCEGCQLMVLQLEERLLELLSHVEVVEWREVSSSRSEDYDIAFCEGSITRRQDIERIREIREQAGTLVSLGSCASIRCHNALKNQWPMDEVLRTVYGEEGLHFDTVPARPVTEVVGVDYQILGCPVSLPEFVTVFKHILTGRDYEPPNQPVCVECKLNDHLCVLEKSYFCLGPLTRCGCNAACTSHGGPCHGCRGLIDKANVDAAVRTLSSEQLHSIIAAVAQRHNLTEGEIRHRFGLYEYGGFTEKS
jgi:coenzyme F420-reducing hydrogenase gamma subunit